MSTNYYLRKLPTAEEINTLKSKIDKTVTGAGFNDVINMVNKLYGEKTNKSSLDFSVLHIGKRTPGYQFQWCANIIEKNVSRIDNGNYIRRNHYLCRYNLTKQGLIDFIMQDNIIVIDESGNQLDKVDFLTMAFNWCKDGLQPATDYDIIWDYTKDQEKFKQFGIEFKSPQQCSFVNDGLVWIIYDDFE